MGANLGLSLFEAKRAVDAKENNSLLRGSAETQKDGREEQKREDGVNNNDRCAKCRSQAMRQGEYIERVSDVCV